MKACRSDTDSSSKVTGMGVLLVGHGTRDRAGCQEFLELADGVRQQLASYHGGCLGGSCHCGKCRWTEWTVEPCFLELAEPTIHEAIRRLASTHLTRMVIAPVLLFTAQHAKQDIPDAVGRALNDCVPGVFDPRGLVTVEPLECDPAVIRVSSDRFWEAHRLLASPSLADTTLLAVGRGSSDSEALASAQRFCELRAALTPVARWELCFMTGHPATLDAALNQIQVSRVKNLIVQPHLLFRGALTLEISARVRNWSQNALTNVAVSRHLGPDPQLVNGLVNKILQAVCSPRGAG